MNNSRKKFSAERGSVAIELAIVMLCVTIITFWSLELARGLKAYEVSSHISYDMASTVYRECVYSGDSFGTSFASFSKTCIQAHLGTLYSQLERFQQYAGFSSYPQVKVEIWQLQSGKASAIVSADPGNVMTDTKDFRTSWASCGQRYNSATEQKVAQTILTRANAPSFIVSVSTRVTPPPGFSFSAKLRNALFPGGGACTRTDIF